MALKLSFKYASALFAIVTTLPPALCHMEMAWPYPLRSRFNPKNDASNIDYSMTSPLLADGSNYPCKGYQNDRPIETTVTYTTGSTYNMTLAGSATHGGGSCQLSLSYDNGASFRVIKSMIGGCPLQDNWDFTIPPYAPAGNALLAWTWQNKIGNREFYMNCAAVKVVSGITRKAKRQSAHNSMADLPFVWKADMTEVNHCTTEESTDPVYPQPGPEVVYADGYGKSSPASRGECSDPRPVGSTYKYLGDTMRAIAFAGPHGNVSTSSSASGSTSRSTVPYPSVPPSSVETATSHSTHTIAATPIAASSHSLRTSTVTVECPSIVTVIMASTHNPTTSTNRASLYTTSAPTAACTGTSASCPCAAGYQCLDIAPCTWACRAQSTMETIQRSSSRRSSAAVTTSPIRSATPIASRSSTRSSLRSSTHSPSATPSAPSDPSRPGYVDPSSLSSYLPCVPGTFICTSPTVWYTCDYNAAADWVYLYPRPVAVGMMCLPNLSPYSGSAQQHAQQGLTKPGYYRDDRIVRARPFGECDDDGSLRCVDGGTQFQVCDQGGWVAMGPVAARTTCRDGAIVGS